MTIAGPGRPKGSPNKMSLDVKKAFDEVFHRLGGVDFLETVARQYPLDFVRLYAKSLPTYSDITSNGHEVKVIVSNYDPQKQLSDSVVIDAEVTEIPVVTDQTNSN